MTTTEKKAELRRLEREAKRLRRELRRSRPRKGTDRKAEKRNEAKGRMARLAEIRVALHAETFGTCAICDMGLPFARMHAHHILSGPERRSEERRETMAPLHEWCHDALHGLGNRDPLPALRALLAWCEETGRTEAAEATKRRLDKIDEARTPSVPVKIVVGGAP